MDVTSSSQTTATTTQQTATQDRNSGVISSDFETFLTMLTAQMENQDPLNPMDSTDFAVQLATFSGVEQQVMTNDLLSEMSSRLGLEGMSQFASWIGKEARVAQAAYFDGAPLDLALEPAELAEQATLIVTDSSGVEVSRISVGTEAATFTWSGEQSNGVPLADGHYRFELESVNQGTVIAREQVGVYQEVTEARLTDAGTEIVLRGGLSVLADSVNALRNP